MPAANPQALDLIYQMIQWNPKERPTCAQCMRHPYFGGLSIDLKDRNSALSKGTSTTPKLPPSQFELHRYKDQTLKRMAANASEEATGVNLSVGGAPLVLHGRSHNPSQLNQVNNLSLDLANIQHRT